MKASVEARHCFAVVVWRWTSMPCQVVSDGLPPIVGPQAGDFVTNDAPLKFALQLSSSTTKSKAPTRNPNQKCDELNLGRRMVSRMLFERKALHGLLFIGVSS